MHAPSHPEPAARPLADGRWHVRLLGALEVQRPDGQRVRSFPTRPVAALLARLALSPQRAHAREALIEALWPGVAPDLGRNRLRHALSALKAVLERGIEPPEPLLQADRVQVRLADGVLSCDALEFERAVRRGDRETALALYQGELMPGHYLDWVVDERRRLAALFERVEAAPAPATPPRGSVHPRTDPPLPAPWTRSFGLELSASRLASVIRHHRLVTVVGPGGCGKTRLALETARSLRESARPELHTATAARFGHVLFVPMVDCFDAAQALDALASLLGVGSGDLLRESALRLADAPTVLVLDNFEQLVPQAVGLVMQLLEQAPQLHLVVTSRMRLGLPGEQVFALAGLPIPEAGAARAPKEVLLNPAVALFIDRARSARADFDPRAGTLDDICQLVRQLNGMPLALELAASRVGSFTPQRMLQLLTQDGGSSAHLHLLSRVGPRSGHDRRQASIGAVIDWSWRLLAAPDQRLMQALAECAGDAGLPMLAAVVGEDPAATAARLDHLVGHSMVLMVRPQSPRYTLLEPVREFVREAGTAALRQSLREGLMAWLLGWARALGPRTSSPLVEAEARAARALLSDATLPARPRLELALSLRPYWESAGLPAAVQDELARALEAVQALSSHDTLASDAHEMLAYLRFAAGFAAEANRHAQTALQLAGDDASRRSRALVRRAWVELAGHRDDVDAGPQVQRLDNDLSEALALARQAGDREAQARALHQRAALISQMCGEWAEAEGLLAESQALWVELGDARKAASRLRNRAQCWVRLGRLDEALTCLERCEREARDSDDWLGQIDSLLSLSTVHASRRHWDLALEFDRRCVALAWQRWHRHGLAFALWNPPLALAHLRRPELAALLMAFAGRHWATQFGPLSRFDRRALRRVRRLVQAQVGAARTQALWLEGEALSLGEAVAMLVEA
ncbi:MAG: ATP-binding protein [Rubrivivax sp.]